MMRRIWLAILAMTIGIVLAAAAAQAHEVRPAYLQIDQKGPHSYSVLWKLPTLGEAAIHLVPHLSNGWLEKQPDDQFATTGFLIKSWNITTKANDPLVGQTVWMEGLEETITDVFVRIHLLDGRKFETVIQAQRPSVPITLTSENGLPVLTYVGLGIEHILTGMDHLLFVMGLLLLVSDRWMLVKTISAFTVAHSITLGVATLWGVAISVPLLNTLIALSIVFLGPEILRAARGGTSLTIRHPWVVAFAFGLLHGFGFASGLLSLGLPHAEIPLALLMFNVGVEIGQLLFITLILALERSFRLMEIRWPWPVALLPTYAVGALGASWTIRCLLILFGGAA